MPLSSWMVASVADRLVVIKAGRDCVNESNSRGLGVLKTAVVDAEFDRLGLKLRTQRSTSRMVSMTAYAAGGAAGASLAINPGIGQTPHGPARKTSDVGPRASRFDSTCCCSTRPSFGCHGAHGLPLRRGNTTALRMSCRCFPCGPRAKLSPIGRQILCIPFASRQTARLLIDRLSCRRRTGVGESFHGVRPQRLEPCVIPVCRGMLHTLTQDHRSRESLAADGKIKRTSFAHRFARKRLSAHCF